MNELEQRWREFLKMFELPPEEAKELFEWAFYFGASGVFWRIEEAIEENYLPAARDNIASELGKMAGQLTDRYPPPSLRREREPGKDQTE